MSETAPEPADEAAAEALPRRFPSTIGGLFYLIVLLVVLGGVGVAGWVDWRVGVRIMSGGLLAAAALRLVLPEKDAGMLAVRHRLFDAALLAVVGIALILLAASIPDQV